MEEEYRKSILSGYKGALKREYEELLDNIDFLAQKLQETREKAAKVDVVIPYDNGGGQSGIRENPIFSSYTKLLTQYNKSISLANEMQETQQKAKSAAAKLTNLNANVKKLRKQA